MGNDNRSSRRLPLELPVRVRWIAGVGISEEARGTTRDISSNGIFLRLPVEIRPQTAIELSVVLPRGAANQPVELQAEGHVTRKSRLGEDSGVAAIIDDYRLAPLTTQIQG